MLFTVLWLSTLILSAILSIHNTRGKSLVDLGSFEQISYAENDKVKLLFSVAEQLKIPLIQIARTSEQARNSDRPNSYETIEDIADSAIQLLDSLLLSLRLHEAGDNLVLQPVSLSAVLHDIAHTMQIATKQHGCDVELHIGGKYEPIMAHPAGLVAALSSLGSVFIDAQNQRKVNYRPVIKISAHRTRYGITAGLFSDIEGLSGDTFKRAKHMYGSSRQPLSQLTAHSGAGVFIADSLLEVMSSRLRVAKHQKLSGLAATFTPSKQMELV